MQLCTIFSSLVSHNYTAFPFYCFIVCDVASLFQIIAFFNFILHNFGIGYYHSMGMYHQVCNSHSTLDTDDGAHSANEVFEV